MLVGEKLSKQTLIAKNADPHIADRITKRKKLFGLYILSKNYILFFGLGISIFSVFFINSSLLPSHR